MNMKKKTFIVLIVTALALCALVGCSGKNEDKTAALIEAVENNDSKQVKRLIRRGADVNARSNSSTMTMLMYAAHWGDSPDIAKLLIAAGADVNARSNSSTMTMLMYAAQNNAEDVARLLIETGAAAKNYK